MPSTNEITLSESIEAGVEAVQERVDRGGLISPHRYDEIKRSLIEDGGIETEGGRSTFISEDAKTVGQLAEEYDTALCDIGDQHLGAVLWFVTISDGRGVPLLVSLDLDAVDEDDFHMDDFLEGIVEECDGNLAIADGGQEKSDREDEEAIAEAVTQPEAAEEPDAINVREKDGSTPDISEASLEDFMGGDSPFASDETRDPTPDMGTGGSSMIGLATGAIPLGQIEHTGFEERKRIVVRDGRTWPSTTALRNSLEDEISKAMMHNDSDTVIRAPTSVGKSYTVASKRWGAFDSVTDGNQVIHAHKTRDARDEAVEVSEKEDVNHFVLRSREELCPVCAGAYDPGNAEGTSREAITVNGMPVSEFIDMKIERNGIHFSLAHQMAKRQKDTPGKLPCMHDGGCPAVSQYEEWRDSDHSVTHCTQPFLYTPGVRRDKHVIIDEEPSFEMELGGRGETATERVQSMVEAYLTEVGAMVNTWEEFWSIATARSPKKRLAELYFDSDNPKWEAKKEGYGPNTYKKALWEEFENQLRRHPDRDWYRENHDSHTAAYAVANAILDMDEYGGGYRAGSYGYKPMRIDSRNDGEGMPNYHHLTIVFNQDNEVTKVSDVPEFTSPETVIGLDAHPSMPVWRNNTHSDIGCKKLMSDKERAKWRRYEKGVEVVQVGDATRPLTSMEYYNDEIVRTIVQQLADEYGEDFRTALTSAAAENSLFQLMNSEGCPDPQVMHYGEEKSRNDFAGEDVGLVLGCIDPGDDMVMNELAVAGLDAEPEVTDKPCPNCTHDDHADGEAGPGCANCMGTGKVREKGRNFVGDDAEEAEEILASVRENHVCQSIGRYGRNPEDPEDSAKVFVATDAMPDYMTDIKVPGAITTYDGHQEEIVKVLRESAEPMNTQEIAREVGCTARNVRAFLNEQAEIGRVEKSPREGENGATLYAETGLLEAGALEVDDDVLRKQPVQGYNDTWCFRTAEPTALVDDFGDGEDSNEEVTADDDAESSGLSGPLDS